MQYTDKMKLRYEVADGGVDGGGYRFVSLYLAISLSRLSLRRRVFSLKWVTGCGSLLSLNENPNSLLVLPCRLIFL